MKAIIVISYLLLSFSLLGQKSECHFIVHGVIMDSSTLKPLELTNIAIVGEKGKGTSSDDSGNFLLTGLCPGPIEMHISHLQCEHIHINFDLVKDTTIIIYLKHSGHLLDGYTALLKNEKQENLGHLNAKGIELQKGSSISELMQNIGGITLLKTGSSISKPVVNGLHSNRVIILNNGIRQEGQNWGMEHAPEIDAFLATEIELMKGAEALRYAADGIGGIIMIKPPSIFNEKPKILTGELNMVGNTNGRGGATSLILGSRISDKVPVYWRVQGTLKKSGNARTPGYFLSNTGFEELNYSGELGYETHKLKVALFYSSFSNKIGIFKGSQIGNINDLKNIISSNTPAVRSGFSYHIDRPFQKVRHQLTKINTEWSLNARSRVQLSVAYQQNQRQEYDMLRSASSFRGPDFNYFINTWLSDITFLKTDLHLFNFSTGINGTYQSNSYSGRFFIPGFYNKGIAAYFIADKTIKKFKVEAAIRYDYKHLTSFLWRGNNLNVDQKKFNNATYVFQLAYQKNKQLGITLATSSAWRPPSPNELYSNGLHQGAATIEIGDSTLKPERSFNNSLNLRYAGRHLFFESEIYYKRIKGFINLIPALPPQLTIRGAFPVYRYVQQDAGFYGLNMMVKQEIKKDYFIKFSVNLLLGENLGENKPLGQIPPMSGKLWLGRENKKYTLMAWCRYTARQFRYVAGSDYAPPPDGFTLFGLDGSYSFKVRQQSFKFNISINNLFNVRYREYLNRFRYFSDEPGFGLTARLLVPLNINYKKAKA